MTTQQQQQQQQQQDCEHPKVCPRLNWGTGYQKLAYHLLKGSLMLLLLLGCSQLILEGMHCLLLLPELLTHDVGLLLMLLHTTCTLNVTKKPRHEQYYAPQAMLIDGAVLQDRNAM